MRFRQWITCEELKNQLVETKGDGRFPETVFAYLSNALDKRTEELKKMPWQDCLILFMDAVEHPYKLTIPIVTTSPKGKKESDWEYPGRTFSHYANLLASAYGWSLEYISDLEVNQAFALIQEILTEQFLEQEFYYSLSDIAYPYNKSTKTSNYKPLERPYWMKPSAPKQPKKVKMRKDFLPMGRVVDVSGLPEEFQIKGYEVERQK